MQLTARQYSEKFNLCLSVVYEKIKKGKLNTIKKNNITYIIVDGDDDKKSNEEIIEIPPQTQYQKHLEVLEKARAEKAVIELQLQKQKLRNLRVNTELAKQKNLLNIEYLKKEICEAVFQCYCESFIDFKNYIIQLRLQQDKLSALNDILNKCIDKFSHKLKQYIKQKENIEQSEQKTDEKTVKRKSNKRVNK